MSLDCSSYPAEHRESIQTAYRVKVVSLRDVRQQFYPPGHPQGHPPCPLLAACFFGLNERKKKVPEQFSCKIFGSQSTLYKYWGHSKLQLLIYYCLLLIPFIKKKCYRLYHCWPRRTVNFLLPLWTFSVLMSLMIGNLFRAGISIPVFHLVILSVVCSQPQFQSDLPVKWPPQYHERAMLWPTVSKSQEARSNRHEDSLRFPIAS